MKRSIDWSGDAIVAVDQCALPDEYRELRLTSVDEVIGAIQRLAIRGAPAIGVAGGLGVALSALRHSRSCGARDAMDTRAVRADAQRLAAARPTAVNLAWAVGRVASRIVQGPAAVLEEALALLTADEAVNRSAAARAAALIRGQVARRPIRVLTHCNTGRLATVAWGTALGAIRELAASGELDHVLVGETRPLLQGSRLTAWELAEEGIPHRLCVDSASPAAIGAGRVDCVIVGADRITLSGDVVNKIGTYSLGLAAARAGVPFVVVAPESTIDMSLRDGAEVVIEERGAEEVLCVGGQPIAPAGTPVFNPAFDVTPAELVTAVATERRVIRPQYVDLISTGGVQTDAAPGDLGGLAARVAAQTRLVADFPEPGVEFHDLSGVYAQPTLVRELAGAVAGAYSGRFDCVLAVEARGFLLGVAVALAAMKPLVLCRKPGNLPGSLHTVAYDLEYGADSLQVQSDRIPEGAGVLVVDDVLATGGTLAAAEKLVAASKARVCGHAVVVELTALGGRQRLDPTPVFAVRGVGSSDGRDR